MGFKGGRKHPTSVVERVSMSIDVDILVAIIWTTSPDSHLCKLSDTYIERFGDSDKLES